MADLLRCNLRDGSSSHRHGEEELVGHRFGREGGGKGWRARSFGNVMPLYLRNFKSRGRERECLAPSLPPQSHFQWRGGAKHSRSRPRDLKFRRYSFDAHLCAAVAVAWEDDLRIVNLVRVHGGEDVRAGRRGETKKRVTQAGSVCSGSAGTWERGRGWDVMGRRRGEERRQKKKRKANPSNLLSLPSFQCSTA